MLIVFDYMIADVLSNKNINPVVTELFFRRRKLNIFLDFLFCSTEKCQTKIYALFSYENSKEIRTSKNSI